MFTNIKITNINGIYGTITYNLIAATKKKDKKDTIKQIELISINKLAATIGPNAVGKSSVVDAISFVINFLSQIEIIENINKMEGNIGDKEKNDIKDFIKINVPSVRNKDRLNEDSKISFGIFIPQGEKPGYYEYSLSVNNNKVHEFLKYKKSIGSKITKLIDEYESNNIRSNIGYKYTFKDSIIQDYERVDSKLAKNFKESIAYINSFYDYVTEKVHTISTSSKMSNIILVNFLENNEEVFKEFINIIDEKIYDFKIKENTEDKTKYVLFILKDGTEIEYSDISTGTRRMIKLFAVMYDVLKNNGIIVCDEIEVSLHRELVQFIIKMFIKNNNYSQLLFTTHDPYIFSFNNIRNDQIYFLRNVNSKSELINIGDINPRSDYSITKNYYESPIFSPRPNEETINNFCEIYFK